MKTASLEVSKKLEAVGVDVPTYARWYYSNGKASALSELEVETLNQWATVKRMNIPAPTACELGELLPAFIDDHNLTIGKESFDGSYWISYEYRQISGDRIVLKLFQADTEADSRGLMLCWLKENGHLEEGK